MTFHWCHTLIFSAHDPQSSQCIFSRSQYWIERWTIYNYGGTTQVYRICFKIQSCYYYLWQHSPMFGNGSKELFWPETYLYFFVQSTLSWCFEHYQAPHKMEIRVLGKYVNAFWLFMKLPFLWIGNYYYTQIRILYKIECLWSVFEETTEFSIY